MNVKRSGSCLCGEINYEIDGHFESFYLCHCDYCRKDTGSAYAANLFSTTAKINWRSGKNKISQFTLPQSRHSKHFCSICGSAVPSLQMDSNLLVVPAGSLNDEVLIRPTAHIFISSKASWETELESIPEISGPPG